MSGDPATRNGDAPSANLLYFYGVIPGDQEVPPELRPLRLEIPGARVAALAEMLDASEVAPAILDGHVQDLEWIARLARRHESVLGRAMRHGPVVPARLCTLFGSLGALERSVAARAGRLTALLAELEGRQEWGLKAFCDETRLRSKIAAREAATSNVGAETPSVGPGAAFLLRKRQESKLATSVGARVADVVADLIGAIERSGGVVTTRPVLSKRATGRPHGMVLNAAVLVDEAGRHALHHLVAIARGRHEQAGFELELSGPWPPYSFCALGDEDAGTPHETSLGHH